MSEGGIQISIRFEVTLGKCLNIKWCVEKRGGGAVSKRVYLNVKNKYTYTTLTSKRGSKRVKKEWKKPRHVNISFPLERSSTVVPVWESSPLLNQIINHCVKPGGKRWRGRGGLCYNFLTRVGGVGKVEKLRETPGPASYNSINPPPPGCRKCRAGILNRLMGVSGSRFLFPPTLPLLG